MKIIITSFLILLSSLNIRKDRQPSKDFNNKAVIMLREFYIAYNTAWATTHNGLVLIKKLDSLKVKYCTLSLRKELKSEFKRVGLDHDILISDQETDIEHLKTLQIANVPNEKDAYIVTYLAPIADGNNKLTEEKVSITVTIAIDEGKPKIASLR